MQGSVASVLPLPPLALLAGLALLPDTGLEAARQAFWLLEGNRADPRKIPMENPIQKSGDHRGGV